MAKRCTVSVSLLQVFANTVCNCGQEATIDFMLLVAGRGLRTGEAGRTILSKMNLLLTAREMRRLVSSQVILDRALMSSWDTGIVFF